MTEKTPTLFHFSIKEEESGEEIASAEVDEFKEPFRFFYIARITVVPSHQGKKYGSRLIKKIEEHLINEKAPGILFDTIENNSPAYGMYARRGWVPVIGCMDMYAFNHGKHTHIDLQKAAKQLNV